MKKLIEHILPVCFHEWEIENRIDILPYNPFKNLPTGTLELVKKYNPNILEQYKIPIGTKYILRCKKCGKMKNHEEMGR
jgi:hypothetical protein